MRCHSRCNRNEATIDANLEVSGINNIKDLSWPPNWALSSIYSSLEVKTLMNGPRCSCPINIWPLESSKLMPEARGQKLRLKAGFHMFGGVLFLSLPQVSSLTLSLLKVFRSKTLFSLCSFDHIHWLWGLQLVIHHGCLTQDLCLMHWNS